MLNVPPKVQQQVQSLLRPDEQVLWSGGPRPARMAREGMEAVRVGLTLVGMALIFGVVPPVLNRLLAPGEETDWVIIWISVGWGGVGLLMCLWPLVLARRATGIAYVMTNRRAFSLGSARKGQMCDFGPEQLAKVDVLANPDGSGDLVFDVRVESRWERIRNGHLLPMQDKTTLIGFLGIPDVERVAALARQVAKKTPQS